MARKPKNDPVGELQAAAGAPVESCDLTERGITCIIGGIYDHIQRQGRSDAELIAAAATEYRRVAGRV